jgi:hypothetical protein
MGCCAIARLFFWSFFVHFEGSGQDAVDGRFFLFENEGKRVA